MKKTMSRKLVLARETLRLVTGGVISTRGCNQTQTCLTFCLTCPKVSRDWPSCDLTYCECLTDLCDKA